MNTRHHSYDHVLESTMLPSHHQTQYKLKLLYSELPCRRTSHFPSAFTRMVRCGGSLSNPGSWFGRHFWNSHHTGEDGDADNAQETQPRSQDRAADCQLRIQIQVMVFSSLPRWPHLLRAQIKPTKNPKCVHLGLI